MIDWQELKAYSSGQRKSFEEFCYQIAYAKYHHLGTFTPIDGSGGDGGVEFYLKLKDKDEVWGWQCKFFDGNGRLSESNRKPSISNSLKTACRNHSNLKKYFVCLKTDLTVDSVSENGKVSIGERTWFEKELPQCIPDTMTVDLDFWGLTDFNTSCIKHPDVYNYFFKDEILTKEWFERRYQVLVNTTQIKNKYEVTLHVRNDADETIAKILCDKKLVAYVDQMIERQQVQVYAEDYNRAIMKLHSDRAEPDFTEIQNRFLEFTKDKKEIINQGIIQLQNLRQLLIDGAREALATKVQEFPVYLDELDNYYNAYDKLSESEICNPIKHIRDEKDEKIRKEN
jgi:hypothetical protein